MRIHNSVIRLTLEQWPGRRAFVFLLIGLILQTPFFSYAGNAAKARFLTVNQGTVEVFNIDELPASAKSKIDALVEKGHPGAFALDGELDAILKYYKTSRNAEIYNFWRARWNSKWRRKKITFSQAWFHFRSKGDCHNYPDRFVTLSYTPPNSYENDRWPVGIILPTAMQIAPDLEVRTSKIYTELQRYGDGYRKSKGYNADFAHPVLALKSEDGSDWYFFINARSADMGSTFLVFHYDQKNRFAESGSVKEIPCGS